MKKGFTLIELMIMVAILGVVLALVVSQVSSYKYKGELQNMGYNVSDVRVFLSGTSFTYKDLYESKGLQSQYSKFIAGEESVFMGNARANKKASDAQSTANMALIYGMTNSGE